MISFPYKTVFSILILALYCNPQRVSRYFSESANRTLVENESSTAEVIKVCSVHSASHLMCYVKMKSNGRMAVHNFVNR